jgi:uncharacterized repeat protein (TIGR03803 family)
VGATTASFDEIRLGESFEDVTPPSDTRLAYDQIHRLGNVGQMAASPIAGVVEGDDGALYGATLYGGTAGVGTIYRLSQDGQDYRVIWNFQPDLGGQFPNALIRGSDGALYGTTGNANSGVTATTVYRIEPDGSNFAVLHRFGSGEGRQPVAGVVEGSDGALYGTTFYGGDTAANGGVVFKLNKDGTGFAILHKFADATEGRNPRAIIEGRDAVLYGMTQSGAQSPGTLYKLAKDGCGYEVLVTFGFNGPNQPAGGLLHGSDGGLYGVTQLGGTPGAGTVFRVETNGTGLRILHNFGGQIDGVSDGANPTDVDLIEGRDGALYGSTPSGGSQGFIGVLFKLNRNGTGYTHLHRFSANSDDGRLPRGRLLQLEDGTLYGVTTAGGTFGNRFPTPLLQGGEGTVFKLSPDGSGYSMIRSFNSAGGDAWDPQAGLLLGKDGALYGTAMKGGGAGVGTVFRINRDGTSYTILKSFENVGGDGQFPAAALIEGADGALYGTTQAGGAEGVGTVFKLAKDGGGYAVLRSFQSKGEASNPLARLTEGVDGVLYGTCFNSGSVFKLNKDGSGYSVLKNFPAGSADGAFIRAPVIQASDGALYGTTTSGGANGLGTLFRLDPTGRDFSVLRAFSRNPNDVSQVEGGLLEGSDGMLYGVAQASGTTALSAVFRINKDRTGFTILTTLGGDSFAPLIEWSDGLLYGTAVGTLGNDSGGIFRLGRDGSGFEVLYRFRGTGGDGQLPRGGVVSGGDGALYGTTEAGGYSLGTIFTLGPAKPAPTTNHPPALVNPVPDQYSPPGAAFALIVPGNTFTETDGNQTLSYSASGLPPGISFDPATRTLGGTPTQAGSYIVIVTATDSGTPPQSATTSFKFTVSVSPPVQLTLTKVTDLPDHNAGDVGLVEGLDGRLYGWASQAGTSANGAIYGINKNGTGYAVLHAFLGAIEDGAGPTGLLYGSDNTLYGVATGGPPGTFGHVFALSPSGDGYRVLKRFDPATDGTLFPAGLMEGSDGTLYGVSLPTGTLGAAAIFRLNKDGSDFRILHNFENPLEPPREAPQRQVIEGPDGRLYGLTAGERTTDLGTVYRLNRDGSGFEIVHRFTGNGQGSGAIGALRFGTDGFLYGVGNNGGATNRPVVFKLRPNGSAFQIVTTGPVEGLSNNRLVEGGDGFLYGTAFRSGRFVSGSIYRLRPDGIEFETLHDLSLSTEPPQGIQPSQLLHASDGFLYFLTIQPSTGALITYTQILLRFGPVPLPANAPPRPPLITSQPQDQTVAPDANVKLSVDVTGIAPFAYQWRRNGVNLPGETNSAFTITGAQPTNSGVYSVAVANSAGAVESQPARLLVQAPALQPGDDFADRTPLAGESGVVSGTNTLATIEPREPNHGGKRSGRSVWYVWRAPETGVATFTTAGSSFDTILAVYSGTTLPALSEVASDDDSARFFTSRVTFNAVAGTDYQIAIAGLATASGRFILSWVLETTSETLPLPVAVPRDRTVGLGGGVTFNTVVFAAGASYQWFFNGLPIPGATSPSFPILNAQITNVGRYFIRITAGNRSFDTPPANLEINRSASGDQAVSTADKFADAVPTELGPLALQDHRTGAPRKLSLARGFSGTQIFTTVGATKDPDEPNHCGIIGGASRWFAYQPESDGTLTVDTQGSTFDTVLAIYKATGADFSGLVELGCNNDVAPGDTTSRVTVPVTASTVHYLVVDGVEGASGTVTLNYNLTGPSRLELLSTNLLTEFRLRVSGPLGHVQTLEASTDLTNWPTILATNPPTGVFEYLEPASTMLPRRFYRSRSTEP